MTAENKKNENKKKDQAVEAVEVKHEKKDKEEVMENADSVESATEDKKDKKPVKAKSKKKKKKEKKTVSSGKAYIKATYNNTVVSLTNPEGDVLSWSSAGLCNFKGAKKSTPYAAQIIVKRAVEKAKDYGLKEVAVFVKGVGTGRESAIRALNANGLNILFIKDITPIPHNGCRPRKPRRV